MPAGRPKGLPRTGGRATGTPNKLNADLRELAGVYTAEALTTLAHIMQHGEAEQARVAACRELLDRAHGRPAQAITGAGGKPLFPRITVLFGDGPEEPE